MQNNTFREHLKSNSRPKGTSQKQLTISQGAVHQVIEGHVSVNIPIYVNHLATDAQIT